jgi:predicted nucleic acid-binding protein
MTNRLIGQNVYVDANVFIYAIEGHPHFATAARALLSFIEAGFAKAITSEFTIAEVLVTPLRQGNVKLVSDYEGALGGDTAVELSPVTLKVLREAAQIRANSGQKLPDCIHVATALLGHCTFIVSQDQRLKADGLMTIALSELSVNP